MNALTRAARPIVVDSLGVIVFAILIAMKVNLVAATTVGASVAAGVVLWHVVTRRPVGAIQWMSLALVVISAGATLLTNDPRFVMAKPTVLYTVAGVVMLRRGWMHRYVPPAVSLAGSDLLTGLGYAWAGLMFLTAAANLLVATTFISWWPVFIGSFPLMSKIVLFGVQFVVMRTLLRDRMLALRADGVSA